jgi:hypothetical protein
MIGKTIVAQVSTLALSILFLPFITQKQKGGQNCTLYPNREQICIVNFTLF